MKCSIIIMYTLLKYRDRSNYSPKQPLKAYLYNGWNILWAKVVKPMMQKAIWTFPSYSAHSCSCVIKLESCVLLPSNMFLWNKVLISKSNLNLNSQKRSCSPRWCLPVYIYCRICKFFTYFILFFKDKKRKNVQKQ